MIFVTEHAAKRHIPESKPVPKAEAGHVVVQLTLRPVNPTDLNHIRYGSNGFFTPAAEGWFTM